jgi:hypothetical protein
MGVLDLVLQVLAEHVWDLAGIAVCVVTAVLIGLEYRESRRSREKALVVEALCRVVLPLKQRISHITGLENPAEADLSEVDVDWYAKSVEVGEKVVKKYFDKLLGFTERLRLRMKLKKFNKRQKELRQVAKELLNALRNLLTNDPHIQSVYSLKVDKSHYPTFQSFVERLINDFYSCYHKYTSVWGGYISADLCNTYAEKVKEHINKYKEALSKRKKIGDKLVNMLEKAVNKAIEKYGIPLKEIEECRRGVL